MMRQQSDVIVVGGGVIGSAIALELRLRGWHVTVLSRSFAEAATQAAAGMLAPHAEQLPAGPMRELCQRSLQQYGEWVRKIEELSGLSTGYWACGILAPVYTLPTAPIAADPAAQWLDTTAMHHAQPGLSPELAGGWWYPEDGQVDNRQLAIALKAAAQATGVDFVEGVTVTGLQQRQGRVTGVKTTGGDRAAGHYILATGAWAADLLPVPVQPTKGQMLAVTLPASYPGGQPLRRVLYGEDIYIVPRQDGRILLGATVEQVGFTPGTTPAGFQKLVNAAIRLYPGLQDFPVQEHWWGFRPGTPDELPILGPSPCDNLTLALGHYRNGILLAPATARLLADQLTQKAAPLLAAFSWERFVRPTPATPAPVAQLNGTVTATSPMQMIDRSPTPVSPTDAPLVIAGRTFQSRLMTGTGKYRNLEEMQQSIVASGCEIVTVAVRRVQTKAPGHEGLAEAIDWHKIWMLPNTAGCKTAEEAIRVARLGREMAKLLGQEDNNFVKLEVIPDAKYLLPDPIGTLEAAEKLVQEGFAVLPYINADPLLAKRLEEVGCATVMPLGSPIGSGQGLKNTANIQIIIENANVPVVVDAGIGTPSEAAQAMELGADALLINTAIAQAKYPAQMARAMGLAAEAGHLAYRAGRIPVKANASASSPLTGTITAAASA